MNRIKWIITLSIIILWLARWSDASKNNHHPVFSTNDLVKIILKYLTPTEYSHFIHTCRALYRTHDSEFFKHVHVYYQYLLISDIDPIDPKNLQRCVTYLQIPVIPITLMFNDNQDAPILAGNSPQDTICNDFVHQLPYPCTDRESHSGTSIRLPVMLMIEDRELGWITERINKWQGKQMYFYPGSAIGITFKISHERIINFLFSSGKLVFIHYEFQTKDGEIVKQAYNSKFKQTKDRENVFQDEENDEKNIIYVFYYLPLIDYSNVLTTHK